MGNCAIVGINWGDEGKGRMVDLLTESYDIVIRYQGGGNAGHTVINEYGKFALHLLPFIATENLMMEAVKRGGDRQQLHEIIRSCSMEATAKMKNGEECDLLSRLAAQKEFGLTETEMDALLTPSLYIGRCEQQVEAFLAKVKPLIADVCTDRVQINL